MTYHDLALISLGHLVLAGTFVLGVLVGCSLKRKESPNGYGNEGSEAWWHRIEQQRVEECTRRSKAGCRQVEADPGERPHR